MDASQWCRPVGRGRQYAIAARFGIIAAVVSILLGSLAAIGPMTGTGLPIALLFGIPIGAVAGVACLAVGHGAWRAVSRLNAGTSVAAWTGSLTVAAVGVGVSWIAFAEPGGLISVLAITPSVVLTLVGATGFYFQHQDHFQHRDHFPRSADPTYR
jgi:hypothetical protein